MSVESYSLSLLSYDQCRVRLSPEQMLSCLRAWRKSHAFAIQCSACESAIDFRDRSFATCCDRFYYDSGPSSYPVQSIAIATPGYVFVLPQLEKILSKHPELKTADQEFLVIPDPIYWQLKSTLVFEKVMKFVLGRPMTNRTTQVQKPEKSGFYYKQLQEVPLNYGSISQRSCGKATLIRQIAFGKRCTLSMRAMIVPDPSLRPNEITLPRSIVESFDIAGQWIILNRMPTLLPENFVALKVAKCWEHHCIGIPLEIVENLNADFDGDECNLYLARNAQSQAECQILLNSEESMGSFTTGLVLSPCQDMLVAYRLFRDDIDFLPYRLPNLKNALRAVYDTHGSRTTFECFDRMRQFYLAALHERRIFGITLRELEDIRRCARTAKDVQDFEEALRSGPEEGCLVTQIESGAKGSYDHLYQMFGSVGDGVASSFWKGLTPSEAVTHAMTANEAMSQMGKIWEPGYSYSKSASNLQGLQIDYLGRLVDGGNVIEVDSLDAVHPSNLLSEASFAILLREEILTA